MKGFFWISVFFAFSTVLLLGFGAFGLYAFSDGIPIGAGTAILLGFMTALFTFLTGLGHYQDFHKELPSPSSRVQRSSQTYLCFSTITAALVLGGFGAGSLFASNTSSLNSKTYLVLFLAAAFTSFITLAAGFVHYFALKQELRKP